MDKIPLGKALEILDLNLKEAKPPMPRDVATSVAVSCDSLAFLIAEREQYGFSRIAQLPHEQPLNKPRAGSQPAGSP